MKTIQEVKNAKKKLEEDISSLISQFEKENEVSVSSMGMETVGFCNGTGLGFTLTGHDELESNASSNSDRIEAMKILHEGGYKTFASIEPIVDLKGSLSMINSTVGFCDLYKVGLLSGKKYNWRELRGFMLACTSLESKFYFKDSFISQADLDRANLPQSCVGRDYDMFKM